MTQANSVLSTPRTDSPAETMLTRRRALAIAGGAAAPLPIGLASDPAVAAVDPVFDLIARHATIYQKVNAMDAAGVPDQDEFDDANAVEFDLFLELLETVPTTLAGIVGLVTHLEQVRQKDPWKFEDNYATPLITALAQAFQRMGRDGATIESIKGGNECA